MAKKSESSQGKSTKKRKAKSSSTSRRSSKASQPDEKANGESYETASRAEDQEYAAESFGEAFAEKGEWLPGIPTENLELMAKAERGELDEAELEGLAEFGATSIDLATVASNPALGGFSAERIIGRDDRVRVLDPMDFPYLRICHLTFNTPSGHGFVGTGWLAGPNLVVTAGHCVYNRDSRYGVGWVSNMKVYPARNGHTKPDVSRADDLRSVHEWTKQGDPNADFGAIILDDPLGDKYGWFAYATGSNSDLQGLRATIAGYPGDKPTGTMWTHANIVTSVTSKRLGYLMDTMGGQSGSPVISKIGNEWVSVGIHNYGGSSANYATRINDDVFDVLEGWK